MTLRSPLRTLGLIAFALCVGCKSQPIAQSPPVSADRVSVVETNPPPLAIETFQAAWEIIRDTHFDTNFNGLNWDAVRTNVLPQIEKARSQEEVRDVIQAMLDELNVSHLMILPGTPQRRVTLAQTNSATSSATAKKPAQVQVTVPPPTEAGSVGLEVRILKNQVVIFRVDSNGAAAEQRFQPGWIIHSIDGEPAIDPTEDEAKTSPRQREFLLWHHAASLLKGPAGEPCVLNVETSAGEKRSITLIRGRENGAPAKLGNLPTLFTHVATNQITTPSEKRIGYLRFNLWMPPAIATIDRFIDENRNSDGIIIDLRGNVGGIGGMVMGVAGHFVDQRASIGKMKMRDNELNFTAFPRRVDLQMHATNTFQGKLAILVDAISLSSAELFAGGMQELGRARVFGQTTGGQALPAVSDRLPNGDLLYHAVADFKTPKGRRLEGNGVVPDEMIPLRLEALRAGADEPLQAALRWIDSTPQRSATAVE